MRCFYGMCMLIGFVVILGTAGASDCGTIEFERVVLQILGGLFVGAVGVVGLKRLEEREEN